jgi:hypothetical protein
MKKNLLILPLIILAALMFNAKSFAQRPSKVVSIIKEEHTFDYYKTMAQQWKKMVDNDPADADAWFNYYYANRYARMFRQDYEKCHEPYFQDSKEIVENASRSITGTYEYYFLRASVLDDPQEMVRDKSVLKAYQLGPDRPEIFSLMVNYYELIRDSEGKREICNRWFNSNDMSPALLNYNYNVLMSLADNSILITNGDNDTYPVWLLQSVKGVRKNVTVLNIYLIASLPEYREKLFRELNIPPFKDDPKSMGDDAYGIYKKVLNHILTNSQKPVYLANTLAQDFYDGLGIEKDLYLVGLAMLYSKTDVDNLALIRNNLENVYLLDYLEFGFGNDPTNKLVSYMNLGYEPMLLKLFKHYLNSGEKTKAEKTKRLGIEISKQAGMEESYTPRFTGE